ncbi:hypothetical protein SynMITS9220M01_035 [Synechococcus phage SynMITS9220M01]|nr:hypothetical protein SynMITS9220M01_035 [Synechococcus phage SynMITS9220M01]
MAIGRPVTLTSNIAFKSVKATATAGQTSFTVTGGYNINKIAVFRNGVRLVDTDDYEARDGSSVTLLSGATLGDSLEFQIFDDFRVADAVTADGGTVNGDVSVAGVTTLTNAGINVTGVITATSFVGDGGNLTGLATTDFISAQDVTVSGVVTATSFVGDGGNLTGLATTDFISAVNVIVSSASTFTGDVSIADKIVHTGDTNTAIRFPAADTFTVETSGSEAIRVSSAGSFGVGTTDPENNLHVFTDANDKGILVKSTGSTSNALNFDANRSGAGNGLASIRGKWNGTTVAQISFLAGDDTSNKDDGAITFGTESAAAAGNANATEIARFNNNGRLGINSTAPERRLDVLETASQTVAQFQTTGQVKALTRYECHGDNPVFVGASRSDFNIEMGGANMLTIDHSTNDIDIAGSLKFNSGEGIDFSATTDGSGTATSELLDDYEEGTWTPVIRGASTAGTYETTGALGSYTKIGNFIHCSCRLDLAGSVTGGGSGNLQIAGFPYTPASGGVFANNNGNMALAYMFGMSISEQYVIFFMNTAATTATALGLDSSGNQTVEQIGLVQANDIIAFVMTYQTT